MCVGPYDPPHSGWSFRVVVLLSLRPGSWLGVQLLGDDTVAAGDTIFQMLGHLLL